MIQTITAGIETDRARKSNFPVVRGIGVPAAVLTEGDVAMDDCFNGGKFGGAHVFLARHPIDWASANTSHLTS